MYYNNNKKATTNGMDGQRHLSPSLTTMHSVKRDNISSVVRGIFLFWSAIIVIISFAINGGLTVVNRNLSACQSCMLQTGFSVAFDTVSFAASVAVDCHRERVVCDRIQTSDSMNVRCRVEQPFWPDIDIAEPSSRRCRPTHCCWIRINWLHRARGVLSKSWRCTCIQCIWIVY